MYFHLCHTCRSTKEPIYGDSCTVCRDVESVRYITLWLYSPMDDGTIWGVDKLGNIYDDKGKHIATEYTRGEQV